MPKKLGDKYDRWNIELARMDKVDGCWIWKGTRAPNGYGRFFVGRFDHQVRWMPAHRFSWDYHHGPIPLGLCVCHTCDQKLCINPAHLFIGTHGENMRDRNEKRRQARGEGHGVAKLDDLTVQWIRSQHRSGRGHKRIARDLGVNKSTVARVLKGETWKHVKEA